MVNTKRHTIYKSTSATELNRWTNQGYNTIQPRRLQINTNTN